MCAQSQTLSSLARGLAKNSLSGNEVLISMKAYCDGSGNAKTSDFLVLAGVAAEEPVWAGFERDWARILANRSPIAPYLHMNEVSHGFGLFKDEDGWDEPKRLALVKDCVFFSQTLDKSKFRSFICSIDVKRYRELKDEGELLPSVFSMCNHWVPRQMFKWYLDNFGLWNLPELYYFFDQNEKFRGPFANLVRRGQKKSRLSNHWHMIRQISPVDMRFTQPLQLADMLAWAHHRKLTYNDPQLKWSSLHTVTDAILPVTRKHIDAAQLDLIASHGNFGNIYFDA